MSGMCVGFQAERERGTILQTTSASTMLPPALMSAARSIGRVRCGGQALCHGAEMYQWPPMGP